jgi:hypothetical protein
MSIKQNWGEFNWNFDKYIIYNDIEKEVDTKGHILKSINISQSTLKNLVKEKGFLLLPLVNQDITKERKEAKNQFTKDWRKIFESNNGYRLHPEFKITYRFQTFKDDSNDSKLKRNRYFHFQMIAYLLCEYIPQNSNYISRKEQIKKFNDKSGQMPVVKEFNNTIKIIGNNDYYVFGIDRGIKQLATLCILNKSRQIQGDFEIFTRKFNTDNKQWEHTSFEKRNILNLSNLRVETTIDGRKVLVDLSNVELKNQNENRQNIKLKQLAYIRKLQHQMQCMPNTVLTFIDQYKTPNEIKNNIEKLISRYKEGPNFADLPIEKICYMLQQFEKFSDSNDEKSKRELIELDAADDLKAGVVANMIGVIAYLLEKYNYKVYIALEDLTRAFLPAAQDGLTNYTLANTNRDKTVTFYGQENLALAGVGTYHYFEMQLLKKLFRIQQNNGDILHLVPAFRSVDNYEKIVRRDKKSNKDVYVNYPFGIVIFVDPRNTSHKCPICSSYGMKNIDRNYKGNGSNIVYCKQCKFVSVWQYQQPENEVKEHIHNNEEQIKKRGLNGRNLHYICNGDDNASYHIALKVIENLQQKK